MSFKIDKQTLNDLAIFSNARQKSIYHLFCRTNTSGGAKLLEIMFQNPLSDYTKIKNRLSIINYYYNNKIEFPLNSSIFSPLEFYLSNTDKRTQLMAEHRKLEQTMKNLMGTNTEFSQIHLGIISCIELLTNLSSFLKKTGGNISSKNAGKSKEKVSTNNSNDCKSNNEVVQEFYDKVSALLKNPALQIYKQDSGKKKISYEKAVNYDKVFRFEQREKLLEILDYVYRLDVYITVAKVARDNDLHFPEVFEPSKNILSIKGMFHPFLDKPISNDLVVDKNSNIIFLTGANMAGKSTFMKTFGIVVFLSHMGFPVPAEAMQFSVHSGLYTTINLPDNIKMGYSHFYAEVLRLKKVAIEVRNTENLVIIFDELFRGTNVKDAHDATIAVTEAFSHIHNCTFLISTHIMEAGAILKDKCDNINYIYLPTKMNGNIPIYTYKLKEGITNDRHGMMIVNNEHIIEIIKNGEGAK
ncbi:MAG: DNA mismatch repair protein [Bacilli bacterium]